MKPVQALLALLTVPVLIAGLLRAAGPEDVQLRQEAVHLLERANLVSMSPKLPNLERTDTFLAFDPAYGTREGSLTRAVIQGTGRREETIFGDYHAVEVWSGDHLYRTLTRAVAPPEVLNLLRITPLNLVRFDHEDVIRAILDKQADGHALHCIEFDTVAGERADHNELCVDAANGTLVSEKLGNDLIENSAFFSFAGELLPGKIHYSVNGQPKLEITQTLTELTDVTPDVLEPPPNAQVLTTCTTFRRALGQSMPQPPPGSRGGVISDVLLSGMIGADGKVHDALVQSSERPELNADAFKTIQQWQFTPALCNGQPTSTPASFLLHFQGY